jgi:hypothetical protein
MHYAWRLAMFCGLAVPAAASAQTVAVDLMAPGAVQAKVAVSELVPASAVIGQISVKPASAAGLQAPVIGQMPVQSVGAAVPQPLIVAQMQQPPGMPPIGIRSVELIQRDLEVLATRHNLPGPRLLVVTRDALGEYFLALLKKLAALPREQLAQQDYDDIGLLTEEFDRSFRVLRGKMTMNTIRDEEAPPEKAALPLEMQKFEDRFSAFEKVKISGDMVFMPQNDFGRAVRDSMAANWRGRINVTAKVVEEDKKGGILGDGYLFARLTAASGRFFPRNKFLLAPTNDINDAVANPYNSGVNEVQVPTLIINNNNSNSVRPTVSFEQAYYTQDLKLGRTKGNFKAGLIYMGNMFDNNNYANSEYLQFFNVAFVNSVSWRPNYIGPSLVASLERPILREKAFLRATAGVNSITDRDYWGSFSQNYELQLGHKFFKGKEGNVRAGYWNHNFRSGTSVPFLTPPDALTASNALPLIPGGTNTGSRPSGFYLNADQKVWKDIGLFARYALNDKQIGEVFLGGLLSSRQSYSFGAEIPAKLFLKKRTGDVIAIAYGHISPYNRDGAITPATPAFVAVNGVPATTVAEVNRNLAVFNTGTRPRDEKVLEVYYRYQINKNVSISPDVQYIWSPGGTGAQPGILVLGTRLTVTF